MFAPESTVKINFVLRGKIYSLSSEYQGSISIIRIIANGSDIAHFRFFLTSKWKKEEEDDLSTIKCDGMRGVAWGGELFNAPYPQLVMFALHA